MKSLLLAATVAAGLLCSVSSADAQFRLRRAASYYSYPSYSYGYTSPSYYSYGYPSYSYSYPSYYSYTSPSYSSYYYPSTWSSYPSTWSSYYSYPSSYYSYPSSYYSYPSYSNYNGFNVTPAGGYFYGQRLWGW